MDFDFNPDQAALRDAANNIVRPHLELPKAPDGDRALHYFYSRALDRALADGGFLDAARMDGFGALEGVIIVEEAGKSPSCIEVGATCVVMPQISERELPRPFALARAADLARPIRFLGEARTLLVDRGDTVAIIPIGQDAVVPVGGLYAYPYARLNSPDVLTNAEHLAGCPGAKLRHWWQVSVAAEMGAALLAAVEFTVQYVKDRRQFGRPIGSFQAVQHRLAIAMQGAQALQWLARRAAWSGSPSDAALAALYAADIAPTILYDLHQFNGAMGMTLEHGLHFWTYRVRALQGELGGPAGHGAAAADLIWGAAPTDAGRLAELVDA